MAHKQPLVAGVIGWPVEHSRSPQIHHAAAKHLGIDLTYGRFAVEPGNAAAALDAVRSLNLRGLSVTTPHKEAVYELVDELTPGAQRLQAVNCVIHDDGHLLGMNTDGDGFLIGLRHELEFEVADARVAIVGAGGAARAIGVACADAGAKRIGFLNRSESRANDAVAIVGSVAKVIQHEDLIDADLVVNATTLGMAGTEQSGALPFDPALTASDATVVDVIYSPRETRLLELASSLGRPIGHGLPMLAGQAAAQFSAWTGQEAPLDVMLGSLTDSN